jgi:hypothetical protein
LRFGYYKRLNAKQKATYRKSDEIDAVAVPEVAALSPLVAELEAALASGKRLATAKAASALVLALCRQLGAPGVRVTVRNLRPEISGGELHGLYTLASKNTVPTIEVWMRTAAHGRVVRFRTFLRTLLHEVVPRNTLSRPSRRTRAPRSWALPGSPAEAYRVDRREGARYHAGVELVVGALLAGLVGLVVAARFGVLGSKSRLAALEQFAAERGYVLASDGSGFEAIVDKVTVAVRVVVTPGHTAPGTTWIAEGRVCDAPVGTISLEPKHEDAPASLRTGDLRFDHLFPHPRDISGARDPDPMRCGAVCAPRVRPIRSVHV